MIYLSGSPRNELNCEDWGVMLTPYMGNRLPDAAVWAADTGCYTHPEDYAAGAPGFARYLRWLDRRTENERIACLFVTVPDVPYDWGATVERWRTYYRDIRNLGYPAAIVTQDGATVASIPWHQVDAIFTGGTVEWKTGEAAVAIRHEAQRRGKWTHMGKVNTMRRVMLAKAQGYDSADGTCLKYGADINAPRLLAALAHPQMGLGRLGV